MKPEHAYVQNVGYSGEHFVLGTMCGRVVIGRDYERETRPVDCPECMLLCSVEEANISALHWFKPPFSIAHMRTLAVLFYVHAILGTEPEHGAWPAWKAAGTFEFLRAALQSDRPIIACRSCGTPPVGCVKWQAGCQVCGYDPPSAVTTEDVSVLRDEI